MARLWRSASASLFHFRTAWTRRYGLPFRIRRSTQRGDAMRLRVLALAPALLIPAPGEAEIGADSNASAFASKVRFDAAELQAQRQGFSFPVVDYTDEHGTRQRRKGIIASKMIAPDTLIEVGLFETIPKGRRTWGDVAPDNRRSRKAISMGLNWRF